MGYLASGSERVQPLAKLFRHIWRCGCENEAPPSPSGYRLVGVTPREEEAPPTSDAVDGPIWTGFGATSILDELQATIRRAERSLRLASYSFNAMVENPTHLVDPLIEATRRGVEVSLILRERPQDLGQLGPLLEAGIKIRANPQNHAKYVVADGREGLMFSANFDGVHGLSSGVETGLRLRADEVEELVHWHDLLWGEASREVARFKNQNEFKKVFGNATISVPEFLQQGLLLTGPGEAIAYSKSLLEKPCLLLTNGSGEEPCDVRLVGLQGTVMLKPTKHGMIPEILHRKDPKSVSLARVLIKGDRDGDRVWVPLGLQVRYSVEEAMN